MNVTRRYIVCAFVTVALGVLAYSVADEDLTPFLIAAPMLIAAWMLNGGAAPSPVPRWAVNLALLAATINMAMSWTDSIADTVSVLCRYLVWLQLIKMFEPRTPRDQAQVLVLSAMLMVGSCLTAVTPQLGAVLLLYLPTLLVTTMLYQLWAEHHSLTAAPLPPTGPPAAAADLLTRLREAAFSLLGRGTRAGFSPAQPPLPRGARRDFRAVCFVTGLSIIGLAAAIYVTLPRGIGAAMISPWQAATRLQPVVGFRNHVQLGASGVLSESRRPVATLAIENAPAALFPPGKPLLLRGAVLDEYDPRKRTWQRSAQAKRGDFRFNSLSYRWRPVNHPEPLIVQKLTILEGGADDVFTVWQPVRIDFEGGLVAGVQFTWNRFDGAMSVPAAARGITVRITSSPAARAVEGPLVEVGEGPWEEGRFVKTGPRARVPDFMRTGPIRAHAERVLADARISIAPDDPARNRIIASVIMRWLAANCSYTREMVAPDDGQDPIEMFLFDQVKGRRGHCEYFASALAAMCMAMDVPVRVITGYVASEIDPATGSYIIRESHAHAWVEVEVRPGHWESFDPSPSSEAQWAETPSNFIAAAVRGVLDRFEMAWVRSIVGFDARRQAGALRDALGSLSAISPADALRRVNEWLGDALRRQTETAELSERRVVIRFFGYVFVGVSVAVLLVYVLVGRVLAAITRRKRAVSNEPTFEDDPLGPELSSIYQSLLRRLDSAGFPKPDWLPADAHIAKLSAEHPDLAQAARRIVTLYYRCRFAGEPVSKPILVEARQALRDAAAAWQRTQRQ